MALERGLKKVNEEAYDQTTDSRNENDREAEMIVGRIANGER